MKLKLVSLVPLKEIDVNDPALMRARAAKDQMNQTKSNPRIGFDQALDLRDEKQDLERQISNLYREMESDPDVEAEGGEVADQYGDTLNRLEARLYKVMKQISSYDMNEGEDEDKDEDDEQKFADAKADYDSMMNESEDKWNAIDVSRKAEKEIDNKEWNSRTTAKLDMLIALNSAGKFKKDFSDDRLQGWVDQNYSWEKLSKQFKVNEDYKPSHRAYNVIDKSNNDKIVAKELSRDKALELAHTNKDYMISATDRLAKEGSCGHGPNGVPGNTPGETQGANADDRTKSIIKKLIQKEIKKLSEKEGVPHYTKDGKEWTGPTHKMPNGKLMTQDPHREDSEELFHKEDLK